MPLDDKDGLAAAIDHIAQLARAPGSFTAGNVELPDKTQVPMAFRLGVNGESVKLDLFEEAKKWRDRPLRIDGSANITTAGSFVALVNRHKDDGSALFVEDDVPSITAVIDYHELDHQPRFGNHRIVYSFPLSREWSQWRSVRESMNIADFAQWVEDHIHEIASPEPGEVGLEDLMQTKFGTPADLIKLARGLQVNVESKVANATVLQTGEGQIVFEESHKDSDGRPLKVPGLFVVAIPIFEGGPVYRLVVRLRYRREGGSVRWTFVHYRWVDTFRDAVKHEVVGIGEGTGLPVYYGTPES